MDPTFLPAWRLAELIRGGAISCLELLDHYIARIERLDGRTNAVVVRDFDRARERARALDRAAQGWSRGAVVRRADDGEGELQPRRPARPPGATRSSATARAHEDALAVQRLTAAGAVVFGKTNVPVSLADWQSYNPVYGATSNPWNLAHTPGGSSGGAAAAMAAGFSALELGSDIGGSIRVPAHYCGVFGHKPSWGLCSGRGQSLVPVASMTDIAVIGPLARSAKDLSLALDVIAGADPMLDDGGVALPPPRAMRLSRTAHCRLVERARPGDRCRDHGTYRRAGRFPGTRRRPGQPHRAPGVRRDGSVPSVSEASQRGAQWACERGNAGANARGQGAATGGRHECRCDLGARGRHDASRVAAPERATLPCPPCLGCVLPGLGCAALSGDRHRRAAAYAAGGDLGTAHDGERPHHPVQRHAVLAGRHLCVPPSRQHGADRHDARPGCRSACRSSGRSTAIGPPSMSPDCWSGTGAASCRRLVGTRSRARGRLPCVQCAEAGSLWLCVSTRRFKAALSQGGDFP